MPSMPSCQVPWYLGHLAPSPLASWLCQEPSPWPPWCPWRHEIPEMRHVHQINLSRNTTYYHGQRAITDMQYSRSEANYFCPSYLNPELPRNSSTEETT